MKNFISILSSLLLLAAPALALDSEIETLNRDFGQSQSYPIIILDKVELQQYIQAKTDKAAKDERSLEMAQGIALRNYIKGKFQIEMTPSDVFELLPYMNGEKPGASAMPFFQDRVHFKYNLCVVIPSDAQTDPQAEFKRILGLDVKPELYRGANLGKLSSMMTSEELKLFSLYHELSHCLDQKFMPLMFQSETDPHQVHLAETFAEINALFLLSQRKGLSQLGYPRSLLRTAYSKYFGPDLAQTVASPFINNAAITTAGGSTHFFAPVLLKAQSYIHETPQRIASFTLAETITLSQSIVENFALSKYGSQALRETFANGRESTLAHYQKMATKAPHIFGIAYKDLIEALAILDSVDQKIENYPKP
jgi:hypothetical protein